MKADTYAEALARGEADDWHPVHPFRDALWMEEQPMTMTDEERKLVDRLRGNECPAGCGSMKFCVCAHAADAADLIERNAEARATIRREARREALEEAVQAVEDAGWFAKPEEPECRQTREWDAQIEHSTATIRALMEEQDDD